MALSRDRAAVDDQLKQLGALVSMVRALVVASFVLGGWQAYVTFTLNQHARELAEQKADSLAVKLETTSRIKEWSGWREQMVAISSRQTALLEIHQADIQRILQRQETSQGGHTGGP